MSMDDFMRSLSDQQKAMFLAALQDSGTPPNEEDIDVNPKWTTTMPPHIEKEFQEQRGTSKHFSNMPPPSVEKAHHILSVNSEDFTMTKNNVKDKRKQKVSAKENTWVDTGEHKNIDTPAVQKTPRTRPKPKKKKGKEPLPPGGVAKIGGPPYLTRTRTLAPPQRVSPS